MRSSPPNVDPNCGSALPVAALGIIAVSAGILHGNAFAIAFGIPLALGPLLLWLAVRRSIDRLEVMREIPDAVFEGDLVDVRLRLTNGSRLPIFYPLVTDVFAPELHATKKLALPYRLAAGETAELSYQGRCLLPRGVYRLDAAVVTISDPFGWIQATRSVDRPHRLKVYPKVRRFGLADRLGAVITSVRDDFNCARAGESIDFFSVREYQHGDPLRKIHWPLTARRGFPVVREFMRNSIGDLHIFLDLHRRALVGVGRGSSLEHAIKIAVAIANRSLARGRRVGIFARGRRDHIVPAAGGPAQMQRVLDLAALARPDGDEPLDALIAAHEHRLRAGDTVFVTVSPCLYDRAELLGCLASLRRRGLRVVAAVFDDVSFRSLRAEDRPLLGERAGCCARLAALGVETFDVSCGADLDLVFAGGTR